MIRNLDHLGGRVMAVLWALALAGLVLMLLTAPAAPTPVDPFDPSNAVPFVGDR